MKKFNNLSDLQRKFIRNWFIFLGVITWLVFGFVSVANEWGLCCVIFSAPFFFLALFIVAMGIHIFIIRLRFKWQIMGVLTKEEYSFVIHELQLSGWDFDEMCNELWVSSWDSNKLYNVETNPAFLEVLDKVKPFWNDRLEW